MKSTATLGIELAGNEIRLALVENRETGLATLSQQVVNSAADLSRVLRTMPRRPSAVVAALSLEQAAIRMVGLPPTTRENLDRMVALEAEAVLPLATDELALSHHLLGMTEQSRLEVLLAAARQSAVQNVLKRVNCLPWVSAEVTVTSAALFNVWLKTSEPTETAAAILRIEEEGSELEVVNRTTILAAQPIPVGCATAVAAPVERPVLLGVGGPEEREIESASEAGLPWLEPLARGVRYALNALSYERGVTVQRLYVCGKGAAAREADRHLSEALNLPVRVLAPADAPGEDAALFTVAYGCAVQAAGQASISLNLTPARVSIAREVEQRRQSRLSWAALAAAVVVAAGLVYAAALHNLEGAVKSKEAELGKLGGLGAVAGSASPADLKAAASAIDEASTVHLRSSDFLRTLAKAMPKGTWLAEVTYNPDSACVIRGYTVDSSAPQHVQLALLQSATFDEVTLDSFTSEKIGTRDVWGFQVTCKFHQKERGRGGRRR